MRCNIFRDCVGEEWLAARERVDAQGHALRKLRRHGHPAQQRSHGALVEGSQAQHRSAT